MAENENAVYVKILVDSLQKKKETLEILTGLTKEQEQLLKADRFSMEAFDEVMDKKEIVIQSLNQLEDGFEAFYKRLELVIRTEKDAYREELLKAQKLISEITDMSVRLQAMEARNKEKFALELASEKQDIRQFKVSSQTAGKYYQNMANQHQAGQSYFMDRKK